MPRIYLNDQWLFTPEYTDALLQPQTDVPLEAVRLPHSCRELPYHYFSEEEYQMLCGYRRALHAPAEWQGKRVLLTFEGAAHHAQVFLNGEACAEHACGYTAFTVDLTQKLRYGQENILTVRLDSRENLNVPPFGHVIDYMTYGGIYRDVYLDIKESCYLADVFLQPDISGKLISQVTLAGDQDDGLSLRQFAVISGQRQQIAQGSAPRLEGFVPDVILWDTENPFLYEIETQLLKDEQVLDTHTAHIGFRKAEFRTDGFYLNNKKLKIRGLNRHQSYPYTGYAMPRSIQENDADILKKELGLNAVRTSHYPQSQHFINRCDQLGLLVFTEIPGWQHIGNQAWQDQAVQNVEEMVLQYRNHPSIILWGVRINESRDNEAFYTRTNALARKLDPTRPTGGVRHIKKSQLLEDVYTYNDFVHNGSNWGCEPKANITPDVKKPYMVTEYAGHMFPTKRFDSEEHRTEHALRHARVLNAVSSHADISGSFGWCMADYNTHKNFGSGDRVCYHGVLDMFRNPKLAAAVYASQQSEVPVLEVSSTMDVGEHPECVRGQIWIFSNADSVRVYKNDRFIKEYFPGKGPFPHLANSPILLDDFIGDCFLTEEKFPPRKARLVKKIVNHFGLYGYTRIPAKLYGALAQAVVLYRMNRAKLTQLYGKYIAEWGGVVTTYRFDAISQGKVVRSVTKDTMSKGTLACTVSSHTLAETTGYDMAAIRIRAVDEYGNTLPFCNAPLTVQVEGPAQLVGPAVFSLNGGAGGTYIRSTGVGGKVTVTISSPQLGQVQLPFEITV